MSLQMIGIVAGLLALGWAFTVRRSPVDCILAALAGVLLLMVAQGWADVLRFPGYYLLPELVLGGLGIALLVRAIGSRSRPSAAVAGDGRDRTAAGEDAHFTPQYMGQLPPRVQRTGLIIIGVIVLVPLLLFGLMIAAFMIGGIGYQERARKAQDERLNPQVEQRVRAALQLPATARFRHHGTARRDSFGRYVLTYSMRCGEYMVEGTPGSRRFIYASQDGRIFLANERGMLRFHDFRRRAPTDPEVGYGVAVGQESVGRVEEAPWSAFCGESGAG